MTVVVVAAPAVALAGGAGFGALAPRVVRGCRPAVATWALTAGAIAAAGSAMVVLLMLAVPLVGQDDALVDHVRLSPRIFDQHSGSGTAVAALAAVAVTCLLVRTLRRWNRQRRAFARAAVVARRLGATAGGVVVVPDDDVDVYALAGRPGVVVATSGLMRALPPAERRAVLAHERAHLRHHHHWHLRVVQAAATLNPCLALVPSASAFCVERWADEAAATSTSRTTTATALMRVAAAAGRERERADTELAAARSAVDERLTALREVPSGLQTARLALPVALAVMALAGAVVVTGHTYDAFLLATRAAHHVLHPR